MKKPHKHAELIKAWADGAEIQVSTDNELWHNYLNHENPSWNPDYYYRIKPQLKPDIVRWGWITPKFGEDHSYGQPPANLKLVIDGETGKLKSAEVLHE